MYYFYNTLLLLVLFLSSPLLCIIVFKKKRFQIGLKERFFGPSFVSQGKPLWIHASSVGEVKIASLLTKEIKKRYPEIKVVISVFTDTGMNTAKKLFTSSEKLFYLPLDLPWITKKVVTMVSPRAVIIIESELWPNFLSSLKKKGVPSILANGRISEKSFNSYRKISFFARWVLGNFSLCCMRSTADGNRLRLLTKNEKKFSITGNLKYEDAANNALLSSYSEIQSRLRLDDACRIILFGCTRDQEEENLLPVFRHLQKQHKNLVIIVAPRHITRVEELESLFTRHNLSHIRESKISCTTAAVEEKIIIIDKIGHLSSLYSICTVAFVGGSLLPFGGQNILEPAVFEKPVLFGPFMANFEEEAKELLQEGGGEQADSPSDLCKMIDTLLTDNEKRQEMGKQAKKVIENNLGAVDKTIDLIESTFPTLLSPCNTSSLKTVEKILIVKLSAIGDVVHALPCLPLLREKFPHAAIAWVVEEKAKEILEGNKEIDDLIIINTKRWRKEILSVTGCLPTLQEIIKILQRIRSHRFDIALDIQGLIKSGIITFLSGAKTRIGFHKNNCRESWNTLFITKEAKEMDQNAHIVDKNLAPLALLGIDTITAEKKFSIEIPDRCKEKADFFWQKHNIKNEEIVIGITPGAAWSTKLWSLDNYASLAERLKKEYTARIVIFWGSDKEKNMALNINAKINHTALIPERTTLKEFCALAIRCNLLIGPDTGPIHIADALGVRTAVLFGPSSPLKNRAYTNGIEISGTCDNAGCYKRRCDDFLCMDSITPDMVFTAISYETKKIKLSCLQKK